MAFSTYQQEPTPEEIEYLVSEIKDWSIAHGLAVRPPPTLIKAEVDPQGVLATTAPVTIFPSPFPKVCFDQARDIQKAYNELYAAIARDEEFLQGIVQEIQEVDEFIADLWNVHLKVKEEGYVQDTEDASQGPVIKQVEFNTIASSFGGLSMRTSGLHKYLALTGYAGKLDDASSIVSELPENASSVKLADGLLAAHSAYLSQGTVHKPCVLFVVQDAERNIFDQRHIEHSLASNNVKVFRLPFSQVLKYTTIAATEKRELLYHPAHSPSVTFEVSVVYYRSAYDPADYPSKESWKARLQIERSNAVKCPSILTQLAGAKKVQQVLATPTPSSEVSILARFNQSPKAAAGLEATFTNIYPMDDSPAGLSARKLALDPESCKRFVLKPQREGGGNNTYRTAIPPFLQSLPESHWKSFILMEIITPPPVTNMILRNGNVEKGGVICELGSYGTCLWDQRTGKVIHNENADYLLRTKGDKSEEGGVAAGFGAMDSVMLV